MAESGERLIDELDALVESSREGCDIIPLRDIDSESDHPLAEFVRYGFTQLEVYVTKDEDDVSVAVLVSAPLAFPETPYLKPGARDGLEMPFAFEVGFGMEGSERVKLYDGEREVDLEEEDPIQGAVWVALEKLHAEVLREHREARGIKDTGSVNAAPEEIEERPDLSVEYLLTGAPLPDDHPAKELQDLGFTSCTVEDAGGNYALDFSAELQFRSPELRKLMPKDGDVPKMTVCISDSNNDRMACILFGGDSEHVEPSSIHEKYWRALDRFAARILAEGYPGYDPGPDYPDLRPS